MQDILTKAQLEAAADAEAIAHAEYFGENDTAEERADAIQRRKAVSTANIACGHIDYLRPYLEATDDERREAAKKAATGQIEIVPTSALREGDLIRCNGCTMQLGPINESKSHKPDEHGAVYWSRAAVIDEVGSHIPKSWLDVDAEGNRTWLVQGNDLAKWRRITPTT